MKNSHNDGNSAVNRVCLRTKDDRTPDRAQIAGAEAPTEVQGPRYHLSHERKDGGARKHRAPPAREEGQAACAEPCGTPQPRLTLSPALLPADGADGNFGSTARLICSEPPSFAKAGCACWQSEQWCQDALQKARSCSLGTREQRWLLAIGSPE